MAKKFKKNGTVAGLNKYPAHRFRCPDKLWEDFGAVANKIKYEQGIDITRSSIIRAMIRDFIEKHGV